MSTAESIILIAIFIAVVLLASGAWIETKGDDQ